MSSKIRILLAATFLVLTAVMLIGFKLTQPRILVLHSYDVDYSWTRDINTGLRRVLDPKLRYQVHWHYMDVKNHPGHDYKRKAAAVALRAVQTTNPDLVIAIDDDAQDVVKHLVNDPHVTIVHAGINGEIGPYGYDKARNTTGILERKPLRDLRDALTAVRSGSGRLGPRVLHVGDRSGSVLTDTVEIEKADWKPFRLLGSRLVDTFEEWQRVVDDAGTQADVLLVSNYHNVYRDASRISLVPPQEIVRWTETHSKIPVVGIGGFFVEEGGMLAIGASGFEQGDVAARMAVRILDGQAHPQDMAVQYPQQFITYLRRPLLEKRAIEIPRLYESFARATNNYYVD